jgi:single-stranded DNA-binding protein
MNTIALTGRLTSRPAFGHGDDPRRVAAAMALAVPRWCRPGVCDVLGLVATQDVAEHCAHTLRAGTLVAVAGWVRHDDTRVPGEPYRQRYSVHADYVAALGPEGRPGASHHDLPERGCGVNAFSLVGRLVRPPHLLPDGRAAVLCVASRAVLREGVDYFDVVVRGGLADVCLDRLRTGYRLAVAGRFERHAHRRRADGTTRIRHRCEAVAVEFLLGDGRGRASRAPEASPADHAGSGTTGPPVV